jgi:hypothetical protein
MEKSQGFEVSAPRVPARTYVNLRTYGLVVGATSLLAFLAGLAWALNAQAAGRPDAAKPGANARVVYPKETELNLEGAAIEGELRNPGEFYFQHRPEEKFDSLVKRRKDFHREMLRDAVLSK